MKRAILTERHKLEIKDVPEHRSGYGEIIVRTAVCGVCRTDRKAYGTGQRDLSMPRVLGHEIAGVISEVGDGVAGYRAGDKVVVHPGLFCGECGECSSGFDQLCGRMRILGFHEDGGFQEFLRIPRDGVKRGIAITMPEGLSFSRGALAEPLACAINMAESMRPHKDDRLLIIGAGALGLLTAKLWRSRGVDDITLTDTNETKAAIAAELGFAARPAAGDVRREEYDAAVMCCPSSNAFGTAAEALKKRGRLGFFSGLTGPALETKTVNLIHYHELRVFGSYGCSIENTRSALALLDGKIAIEDSLVHRISMDELEDDLRKLERGEIFTHLDFE
ncbi:MAG: alcohol dehydrogenase catalytic domain-containing protein [Synergistaceae bacterium]|nr:alcohol dehydrogenase catalytic domain-containing protein [Synergistaceae bacterium]